ncbi:glycoside hydrolase family 76 protein [Arcticibacter tournemirensis]|uniref:Glycosyl hydrolase family 76 n=1 Tax=Arcticibacter tournemirensis TaxID=699437 RepID=A0A4Q0M3B4_9SPHI|nr:glycoside hydrolase family 76 protein [Arcticibacter tournemirensis]RXF67397.1 glycosyl hydrolase family 76 [Arcticibacter tournemirensis]
MKIKLLPSLLLAGIGVTALSISSCSKEEGYALYDGKVKNMEYTWAATADSMQEATYNTFKSADGKYFLQNNAGNTGFNYWWEAHVMDVFADGYIRTANAAYKPKMTALLNGIKEKNGNTFLNEYYDDMEWLALSCLRVYNATGDNAFKTTAELLWTDIKTAWTDAAGGGMLWKKTPPISKNACSNGPASILASRMYQLSNNPDDLAWAKKIYAWEKANLVDPSSGIVWDNLSVEGSVIKVNKDWKFTYNQGTYIGAALELYKVTKDRSYLTDAMRTTNTCMNSADINKDGMLKSENQGDGGLFKGILVRYMTLLALEPDLNETDRGNLVRFLKFNAETFYTKGLARPSMLAGPDWTTKPSGSIDLSTQISGLMLMEAAAALKKAERL